MQNSNDDKRTKANGKPIILLSQDLARNLFHFQDIEIFGLNIRVGNLRRKIIIVTKQRNVVNTLFSRKY